MGLCVTDSPMFIYAYYADEIDAKQTCPGEAGFKFNRFTRVEKNCGQTLTESSCTTAKNPLSNSSLPFPEAAPKGLKTPAHFTAKQSYHIYVSKPLVERYKKYKQEGGTKPKADITLFCGVGPEMSLFGMRAFFEKLDAGILITIPGIEADWKGYGAAWGIGIDKTVIASLLKGASVPDVDWRVTVMAGYSTGYRGLNGLIANASGLGLDLSAVKRAIYFDCLYNADDHVANNKEPAYAKRYTQRAIDTLIKANSKASIVVYRVTVAGTPRGRRTQGLLVDIPSANLVLVDISKADRFAEVRALCLARFIQNAIQSGIVKSADLPSSILALVNLLPRRGSLVTENAGQGEQNLVDWLAKPEVALRIKEMYSLKHAGQWQVQHMINLTIKHDLLGGWQSPDWHDMMHRYFVQELSRAHLT